MSLWLSMDPAYGAERGRQRRMMNHNAMATATKATPMMPPTTPFAMSPPFELPLDGDTDSDEGEGVRVDLLFLVEVGAMVTLPVTSGESDTELSMRKKFGFFDKATHCQQAAPPLNSRYHQTAGRNEMGSTWTIKQSGYSWVKICPFWHSGPHWDGFGEAKERS